jgi:hypothetical protein
MYDDHVDGKVYKLSTAAQDEYHSLVDVFAHFLDDKYCSVAGEI